MIKKFKGPNWLLFGINLLVWGLILFIFGIVYLVHSYNIKFVKIDLSDNSCVKLDEKICDIPFEIEKDLKARIGVYYRLKNFN